MLTSKLAQEIRIAVDSSERQNWTAELHLQIIKHAHLLQNVSGKEFCEKLAINASYGTEFSKMKKIASRLVVAGLDPQKI